MKHDHLAMNKKSISSMIAVLLLVFATNALAATGDLDTTFSTDGKVTTDFGGHTTDFVYGAAIQQDGRIVMTGYSYNGSSNDFALARYNSDGSLDASFGSGGKVTTDFSSNSDDRSLAMVIQSDGKFIVVGYSNNGNNNDFALARYNSNGALDTSFGSGGKVTTDYGNDTNNLSGIALQSDGKIVVMGSSYVGSNEYIALVRYNSNGSLDTTFDTDGITTLDFGYGDNRGFDLFIQPDGKIIVVGRGFNGSNYDFVLARYNSNGSLDTTFDTDGKVTTDFNTSDDLGFSITPQADNKIVVAGFSSGGGIDFALARYNSDGSLDTTFDTDGKVITDFNGGEDRAVGIALQSNGKIIAAGWSNNGTDDDFALARYNSNGSLDTTFGTNGQVVTTFGSGEDKGRDVLVQSDGRIVVAGWSNNGNNFDFALARYIGETIPTFVDVPNTYWAWNYIERLYSAGITGGCSTGTYCPENSVTRAQMAVFLEKGLHYPSTFTAPDVAPTFNDTVGHWAEDWIEALKSDGVTAGCATGLYCPDNPVNRAQMAVFLLKSKYGSAYTPPAVGASTGFTDVPTTHWAAAWIKQLAAEGITGGCGVGTYCPDNPVTRAQMAVFLVKTFNLP